MVWIKERRIKMEDYKKKYEEVIKRAKEELKVCGSLDCDAAKQILRLFPELKESEDEKIRKCLIAIITDFESLYLQENYLSSREDILAWLEKHGEQEPAEWSEEDEKFFKSCLWHISNSVSNGKCTDSKCQLTDWLKSIKERYTWKPSNEHSCG
jgi:hypothetical protein